MGKSHFANKKLIKIWLTIDEYNEIKYCAKKYNLPISKYSKGIIMNENTGKIIIPEKEKLLSIAQRISITEFQLLRIGQREIANEIEQCSSELIEYLNNRI